MKPRYQELDPEQIPEGVSEDGKVRAKVLGGEALGVQAKIDTIVPVVFVDVMMQPGASFLQRIPQGYTAVAYCYRGRGYIGAQEKPIKEGQCAEIDTHSALDAAQHSDELHITTEADSASFIILAGEPIREPIARHGPVRSFHRLPATHAASYPRSP